LSASQKLERKGSNPPEGRLNLTSSIVIQSAAAFQAAGAVRAGAKVVGKERWAKLRQKNRELLEKAGNRRPAKRNSTVSTADMMKPRTPVPLHTVVPSQEEVRVLMCVCVLLCVCGGGAGECR
jgi:hypothetical protein